MLDTALASPRAIMEHGIVRLWSFQLLRVVTVLVVLFSTPTVCRVCSVKPEVLEEIAPLMRTLQGHALCVHARVDDVASGFIGNGVTTASQSVTDALMLNAKPMFECAEVG